MRYKNISIFIMMILGAVAKAEDKTTLTIYEQGRAWVQEVRECELPSRNGKIVLDDLPTQLDPESVQLKSITSGGQLVLMNHAFYTPLANATALYQIYIGQSIQVITQTGASVTGKLLQESPEFLMQDETGHLIVVPTHRIDHVVLPPVGRRILKQPYLEFVVDNMSSINQQLELSYITHQLDWHANYIAELSSDEKTILLSFNATIANYSGKDYNGVKVVLVSGDINWEKQSSPNLGRRMPAKAMSLSEDASYGLQDEPVYEYHRYPFPFLFYLKNGETRKHHFFAGYAMPVEKRYVYDSQVNPEKVASILVGKNTTFMSFPKGTIQLFQVNENNTSMLIGESKLKHTPKNSEIRLKTGFVFDVEVKRTQTNQNMVGSRMREESYEITFDNAKDKDIAVNVIEHLHGEWKIIDSSIPFKQKDSETAEFVIELPKGKKTSLQYTVQTKW